jgi:hypothetical protein
VLKKLEVSTMRGVEAAGHQEDAIGAVGFEDREVYIAIASTGT